MTAADFPMWMARIDAANNHPVVDDDDGSDRDEGGIAHDEIMREAIALGRVDVLHYMLQQKNNDAYDDVCRSIFTQSLLAQQYTCADMVYHNVNLVRMKDVFQKAKVFETLSGLEIPNHPLYWQGWENHVATKHV